MSRLVTATIHADALRHNFDRLRDMAAPARVMAMIKAEAYGHGLERVAGILSDVEAFGVASLGHARRLRAAGFQQRILVLAGPDCAEDIAEFRSLRLDAAIHHVSQLEWLSQATDGQPVNVWLLINSGMHRLGFAPDEVATVYHRLQAMKAVADEIVCMTHFAASDEFDNDFTAQQIATFNVATQGLDAPRSMSNSAAVLGWEAARGDWVRTGGLLYGLSVVAGKSGTDLGFEPAMTLTTKLLAVNHARKGAKVGYGCTFTAPEDMPLGVAAIGYGDGYPRCIDAATPILVNGKRCALAGRVSMDLLTIDLRNAPDAKVGDVVTLWGRGLPIEEVADHAGTISYHLACGLTRRVFVTDDDLPA